MPLRTVGPPKQSGPAYPGARTHVVVAQLAAGISSGSEGGRAPMKIGGGMHGTAALTYGSRLAGSDGTFSDLYQPRPQAGD